MSFDPKAIGAAALARIEAQHGLGPRSVGSAGHRAAQDLLAEWLQNADAFRAHAFDDLFFGERVTCRNLHGRFAGERRGRILLGTHYDTRPWADRDPDPGRRREPVPGANDGGSGVALLCELAPLFVHRRDRPTVDVVLFDAEDWHDIDGKQVSLGARRFVDDLAPDERPDRVLIVDMVAGRDLMLDVDVSSEDHDASYRLTLEVFKLGAALKLPAFALKKPHPYKWVECDHAPFRRAGMASALLIDLDYPEWHTTRDLPAACDAASLAQVARFLEAFVFGVTV